MVNIDETIIARLESYGEKFEILVDPDLAADFRNPDNEKEINIEDILAVEEIFKDSKKGDKKRFSRIPKRETKLPMNQ